MSSVVDDEIALKLRLKSRPPTHSAPNHTGGYLNGVPAPFNVPKTGLPDLTATTRLMLIFTLLSALLWGYVISRRKLLFGKSGA